MSYECLSQRDDRDIGEKHKGEGRGSYYLPCLPDSTREILVRMNKYLKTTYIWHRDL